MRAESFSASDVFPRELSRDRPLLFLVAPALHMHPATGILLHYISPEIEWAEVGIDERWRDGVRAVFRKRPRDMELKLDPRPLDPSPETVPDLLLWPGSEQTADVHKLGQVICVVVGHQ
jgi:hypothetical protein